MSGNIQNQEGLKVFIEQLRSADNEVRKNAESLLAQYQENEYHNLVLQLLNFVVTDAPSADRHYISVILRNIMSAPSFKKLTPEEQLQVKTFILQTFTNEKEPKVRRGLGDVIIQIAGGTGEWPEALQCAVQASMHPNDMNFHEIGCYMIGQLAAADDSTFVEHKNTAFEALTANISNGDYETRVAAALAVLGILSECELTDLIDPCLPLFPRIVDVLKLAGDRSDETKMQSILENMETVIVEKASSVQNLMLDIVMLCMEIYAQAPIPLSVRHSAANVITAIADSNAKLFKKQSAIVERFLNISSELAIDIPEEEDWVNTEYGTEDELSEDITMPHVVGETHIRRISIALRDSVYQFIKKLINQTIASPNWKQRRLPFLLLEHSCEGCNKPMEGDLSYINDCINKGLADEHPRIVYVAVQSIAALWCNIGAAFNKRLGQSSIKAIISLMNRQPCLLIQACAACTLEAICESETVGKKSFKGQVEGLVRWLLWLCNSNSVPVQCEAIGAMGGLAKATKDDFYPYYHQIINGLIEILKTQLSGEDIILHLTALDSLSSLVSTIGINDKKEACMIMDFVIGMVKGVSHTDERINALLECATDIFEFIDEDQKVVYLDQMIPFLLEMANREVDMSLSQVLTEPTENTEESNKSITFSMAGLGTMKLSINTDAVDSVFTAIRLIHNTVINCKKIFLKFVEPVYQMAVERIKFLHPPARGVCAMLLGHLLDCMVSKMPTGEVAPAVVNQFLRSSLEAILPAFAEAEESEERKNYSEALQLLLSICYESGEEKGDFFINQTVWLTPEECSQLIDKILEELKENALLLTAEYDAAISEGHSPEEILDIIEESNAQELECGECLLDALGYVARVERDRMIPIFQTTLLPFVNEAIVSSFARVQFLGVCIVDDMIEFAPNCASPELRSDIMAFYLKNVQTNDPALRQACFYGIKLFILHFVDMIVPQARAVAKLLIECVKQEDAMSEDYLLATDNCISAMFVLITKCNAALDKQIVANCSRGIIEYVPAVADELEANCIHALFMNEIVKGTKGVFSNANDLHAATQKLPLLLMPHYDETDNEVLLINDETKVQIISFLKSMPRMQLKGLLEAFDSEVAENTMNLIK